MGQLVNIENLVLVSATCESGGKTLHEIKDCPRTSACPVWASIHRYPLSFAEAQQQVKKIAEDDRGTYVAMRKEASDALEADMRERYGDEDSGFDIGSSDVSIKVIEMYRFGEMEV